MSKTKMHIYGCGGAGINITRHTESRWDKEDINVERIAEYDKTYIDTSRSNIKDGMKADDIYVIPNLDGSGKKRDENHVEINNLIKDILVKHKPQDFNVVIFSLSGGSGSVIGPLLVSELLARNIPVIAITVGTDESVLTAKNTLNSLKSLEAIAKRNGKALNFIYQHNQRGIPRGNVDSKISSYLSGMRYLFSGNNEELDSQDLINWLDFTRTTSLSPQLGLLEVYSEAEHVLKNHPNPVSVASLYNDKDVHGLLVVPEYHCAGYTDLSGSQVDQLHMVIDVKNVPQIAKNIEDTLANQREVAESRPSHGSLVNSKDNVDESGLVL